MPSRASGDPGIRDLGLLRPVVPRRGRRQRRAVLLYGGSGAVARERLAGWLAELAHDRVLLLAEDTAGLDQYGAPVASASSLEEVVDCLRRSGQVDVVVDLLGPEELPGGCPDHRSLLEAVLPHLARRGVFVHDRLAAPVELGGFGTLDDLLSTDGSRASGRHGAAAVAVTRELVLVSQRHRRYLLLREREVPDLLLAREPALAVEELDVLPAGELVARSSVHHHGEPPSLAPMLPVLRHPRLATRHYRGPVALGGRSLMWSGSTVLPDSFRWHLAPELSNPLLEEPVAGFARLRRRHVPGRSLEGDFYQLDSTYPSHFGHVLTEVVSRLWGWDEAKRRMPTLKVLFHPRADSDPGIERAVFAAYGIGDDDVVAVPGAVRVTSVVSASPMWHNAEPHYVHPAIAEVWERLGAGLRPHETGVATSPRIFVSRSPAAARNARICRNLAEVERRFAARGFAVLYPEQHSLADQARIFREARVVAGFGGSALFNVMHTRRLDALVVLNHSGYFARNEHLFTAVKGGSTHYFWSPPDVRPENPWSKEALRSDWEFDVANLGDDLDRLLSEL